MSKFRHVCLYCDHKWELSYILKTCPRCHYGKIKVKEKEETKGNVFGYPEEEKRSTPDYDSIKKIFDWGVD